MLSERMVCSAVNTNDCTWFIVYQMLTDNSLVIRQFYTRSSAACREPGVAGDSGQSSGSRRRRNGKPQSACTYTGCFAKQWHSGRTTAPRYDTGEANVALWSVWVEWLVCWLNSYFVNTFCLHVRRNQEQQACRQGDLRCMRWAVEKWKQVTALSCLHICSHNVWWEQYLYAQGLKKLNRNRPGTWKAVLPNISGGLRSVSSNDESARVPETPVV